MNCHQVQLNLSLYLYGELDFAQEEQLEEHLAGCAFCQRTMAREKNWHAGANAAREDVSLDLLSSARQNLRNAIVTERKSVRPSFSLRRFLGHFDISATSWSLRLAVGSFLVFLGFGASQLLSRQGLLPSSTGAPVTAMGMLSPDNTRIRDIQPGPDGNVHIIVDQVKQHDITGRVDESDIRRWLLAATRDQSDAGLRAVSVEVLTGQSGDDVRNALLNSVQHDPNPAVRLKALQGLRPFSDDRLTREAVKAVLMHDQSPDVRSEAIDVLAPADRPIEITPDLAVTLQQIMRSDAENDYVRSRCVQVLRQVNAPSDIY